MTAGEAMPAVPLTHILRAQSSNSTKSKVHTDKDRSTEALALLALPRVGQELLIKEGSATEKHTGKRMPRLPPLAVLSCPYEASQKWRPS